MKFKISFSYSSTLNDSTEIFDDYPIYNLLSKYSEIEDIIKENDLELLKYFYFNRTKLNKFIYDEEKVIEINSKITQNKYSEDFYLTLLIEDNTDIVNYKYSFEFIKEINHQMKETKNDFLRELMMSKIISVLIKNYEGIDEYDKNEIDELKNLNLERIESNINKLKDLNLNKEDIINKKIDEIYIGIIMDLIKTNKIDDIEYTDNIMMQLELENINLTKTMYDGLANILKFDNNYMKKYIISDKKDLYNNEKTKEEVINFYYILFRYILKKPIYIYQIEFLKEIRKKIFSIIKGEIGKNNNEKLEYIFNFFTNSYYTVLLYKLDPKKVKNKSKSNDNSTTKAKSLLSLSVQSTSSSLDNDNNSIIKFEKHIDNIDNSKRENYTRLIREMSNGDIIRLHNVNDITIYKKDKEQKIIKFDSISSTQKEIVTNWNTSKRINLEEFKNNKALRENKSIDNIIETTESIEKKDKNFIQVMECSKEGLMIYNLSDNEKIIVNTLKKSCTGCFEIKDNSYVVIGEKGIVHYKNLINLEELSIKCEKDKDKDKCEEKNLSFRGCIKINDNYIALTSNSILPNGKDILFIYDTNMKRLIKSLEFSFLIGVNGLNLMDIIEEEDKNQKENKLLLCACKKYTDSQKNQIIIIDTNNIKEEEELYYIPYDTFDFEVSCFCPLKIQKDNKIHTNYFLAGGLDKEKKQGMIKLYRVQSKEENKIEIEFLQDIVLETNDKFTGFNSNIECMIQRQSDGKILVSSSDGNLTQFSEPNLDYYLEENQILEELIKKFS